jgi:hypothetical protein
MFLTQMREQSRISRSCADSNAAASDRLTIVIPRLTETGCTPLTCCTFGIHPLNSADELS